METKNYEQQVKDRYANEAKNGTSKGLSKISSCCGNKNPLQNLSLHIGYSSNQLNSVPDQANLGLGCGNPLSFSFIKEGDTVLDFGSGGGFDCFIASSLVGENGKVIGIDFTPEMIEKAKTNAKSGNYRNVDFIMANIDAIPLPDNIADLVISNCVINLAEDKQSVFNEAYRLLNSGGHLSISDTILMKELPGDVLKVLGKYINCFSGAVNKETYLQMITQAGFKNVKITKETHYPVELMLADPVAQAIISELNPSNTEIKEILDTIVSVSFYAEK